MHWISARMFCSAILLIVSAAGAQGALMGSLVPHDAPANSAPQQEQQWVIDPRNGCKVLGSDFNSDDSVSWSGACAVGLAWGTGTLSFLNHGRTIETINGTYSGGVLVPGHVSASWSDGSRYDGNQLAGLFDGTGAFTSAAGDKMQGEWKVGALNGRATVQWANGDRYDGEWKEGKSDGQGTEVWADGHHYQGLWQDGKPVESNPEAPAPTSAPNATPAPSPPLTQAAMTESSRAAPGQAVATVARPIERDEQTTVAMMPLRTFVGTKLVAVDGSTLGINASEGGFARVVMLPSGVAQEISFAFMNKRIGTVSNDSTPIGLFRANPDELDIDYADGSAEVMKIDSDGGLLVTSRAPGGDNSCTAWYPEGHAFGDAEKKAAVLEYAARLGIAAPPTAKKSRGTHDASPACGGAFLIKLPQPDEAGAVGDRRAHRSDPLVSPTAIQPTLAGDLSSPARDSHSPQAVSVKPSGVHLIDEPYAPKSTQGSIDEASFVTNNSRVETAAKDVVAPAPVSPDAANAAQCLSVASNGAYWGFQNSCERNIQFVYCEMSDSNPLTSCHQTTVSGSVTTKGFSALVTDGSLAEKDVKHEFRWMACDGGAGEVVPHLDSVDPPVGRCQRTVATVDR